MTKKSNPWLPFFVFIIFLMMVFMPGAIFFPNSVPIIIFGGAALSLLIQGYLLMSTTERKMKIQAYVLIVFTVFATILLFYAFK